MPLDFTVRECLIRYWTRSKGDTMKYTLDFEVTGLQLTVLEAVENFDEHDKTCVELMEMGLIVYDYVWDYWRITPVGRRILMA